MRSGPKPHPQMVVFCCREAVPSRPGFLRDEAPQKLRVDLAANPPQEGLCRPWKQGGRVRLHQNKHTDAVSVPVCCQHTYCYSCEDRSHNSRRLLSLTGKQRYRMRNEYITAIRTRNYEDAYERQAVSQLSAWCINIIDNLTSDKHMKEKDINHNTAP